MKRFFIRIGFEHFAFGLVLPISIIWKLQNGLSLTEVAFTESVILLMTVIAEIPAGYFADKFSNRYSLGLGSLAHFIALLLTFFANNILLFSIAALFFGIGWAFVSGADEAHLHDNYIDGQKNFQRNVSKMQITDEASTILGMAFSSLIVLLSNGRLGLLFIIATIIMGLVSVYTFLLLPARTMRNHSSEEEHAETFKLFIKSIKKYWVVFILLAIVYEYGRFLWQPKLESSGINIASLGIYFAIFKIASILGSYLASKSHFSRNHIIGFFCLTLISLLSFTTVSSFIVVSGRATSQDRPLAADPP